jgi:hypothetical protein
MVNLHNMRSSFFITVSLNIELFGTTGLNFLVRAINENLQDVLRIEMSYSGIGRQRFFHQEDFVFL